MHRKIAILAALVVTTFSPLAQAQPKEPPPTITMTRAAGPITLDGEISDAGWQGATRIDTWFETNPGDNIEPKVKNVGYLTYDDRFLYAAFEFYDPEIGQLRAPFGDRDNVPGSTDYGGIIVNPSNDRKTALLLLANARGIQYDALTSDASGEDSSPDYYWDASAKVHPDRWVLELRVPFSSLRYSKDPVQTWGIILYRNYPRDRRYQMFSAKLPRDVNCFICNSNTLAGLENLPDAGNLVAAPYVTTKQESFPRGELGTSLETGDADFDIGADAKWTPNADTAIDLTLNPDFSQVESDVAAVTANERFAIFFPEKRPFFLEGIDLFSTPIQAVYTRSITAPRWGLRATGKLGGTSYTTLVADDEGGGSVILPGPEGSDFADQEFDSINLISRFKRDFGSSFGSFLVSDREVEGGGHNRVMGPDFQWRPNSKNTITGQLLYSDTETPDRPELHPAWTGQKLSSHAGQVWWNFSDGKYDFFTQYTDLGEEFRADLGFVPQVGYNESYVEGGRTWRPKGFFNRVRLFTWADRQERSKDGALLFQQLAPGVGMDGRWASFLRFWVGFDKVGVGDLTFDRRRLNYVVEGSPNRIFNRVGINGWVGEDVDFVHNQLGDGANINLFATIRPTNHLELAFTNTLRYLDVTGGRLFTAQVERLKATYTFTAKSFIRVITQHVRTDRDLDLYEPDVAEHGGSLTASALFAYKLNWQTVLFIGYGDNRALTEEAELEQSDRQLFMKVSYAFQW